MKYELVIFDWDGTLMDSVDRIVSSMQIAALKSGLIKPSSENVKSIIGFSLDKAVATLFPDITNEQAQLIYAEYKLQYVDLNDIPTPYFKDVELVLEKLHTEGRKLAVATGKGRPGLERVWGDFKGYFHASRCADEAQSKPHSDMLEQLLNELNVDVANAVMIGDTVHDMAMAEAIGMDRIGVTYGVHSHEELTKHTPIAIVNNTNDLLKHL